MGGRGRDVGPQRPRVDLPKPRTDLQTRTRDSRLNRDGGQRFVCHTSPRETGQSCIPAVRRGRGSAGAVSAPLAMEWIQI